MSISRVELTGWPLRVFAGLWGIVALSAAVAFATYWLPHHVVYDSGFGDALGCLFRADCNTSSSPARGPGLTHAGYAHSGILPALLLAAVAGAAAAAWRWRRFWPGVALSIAALGTALATALALFDLAHMFDKVTVLWAERAFGVAVLTLLGSTFAVAIATPLLYLAARRRGAR